MNDTTTAPPVRPCEAWATGFWVGWTSADGAGHDPASFDRLADAVACAQAAGRGSFVVAAWGPRRAFIVWRRASGHAAPPYAEIG